MLIVIILAFFIAQAQSACYQRVESDGLICVCNSTHCDTVPELGDVSDGVKLYYTSIVEPGFNVRESAGFTLTDRDPAAAAVLSVTEERFQTILGFGGAFTDSASINMRNLPEDLRQSLLESYFGDDGIEYSICRVPLGACDFSPRQYTLDDSDQEDPTLRNFALQEEDLRYKIPAILQAQSMRGNKPLNLFASAWTAPLWMKDKQIWFGGSELKEEYYQTWADYHVKFFDEYLKQGVKFWGFTIGNEPLTGFYAWTTIPSMGWNSYGQLKWFVENLGPTIKNSTHKDLKIMIFDENLIILPFIVPSFFGNDQALQYIDGVATHWYWDGNMAEDIRNLAKTDKKDTFILESETCHYSTPPLLGSWPRAAEYLDNIITDLQYGYAGWVEWNLALNFSGGPTHIEVPGDAPIIIGENFTEFYKQPTFYAIGHFSKFVSPGSVRIGLNIDGGVPFRAVAFLRPDNLTAIVVYNNGGDLVNIQLKENDKYSAPIQIPGPSVSTILYRRS